MNERANAVVGAMNRDALIKGVREYAIHNYNREGWDVVVEAWEDEDILRCVQDATTVEQAIENVREMVKIYNDVREDIRNA